MTTEAQLAEMLRNPHVKVASEFGGRLPQAAGGDRAPTVGQIARGIADEKLATLRSVTLGEDARGRALPNKYRAKRIPGAGP